MKVRRSVSLSIKVLERARRRRAELINSIGSWTLIISTLVIVVVYARYEHKRTMLVGAPSWADFSMQSGKLQGREYVRNVDDGGIPFTLMINGEHWNLVKVNHFAEAEKHESGKAFNGVQAETFCDQKLISYIETQDDNVLRENLWHEIFHAGACLHNGDTFWNSENPTKFDHPGVYHLGQFTSNFVRDNPLFMAWAAGR